MGSACLTSVVALPTLAELTPARASGPRFLHGFIRPLIERSWKRLRLSQAIAHRRDTAMPTGTIARLHIDKGFGFIRDEGGIEHFFHRSAVRGAVFELLREGQR